TPPPAQLELGRAWRREFGARRPVLLAASTREGEEALLLDAFEGIGPPELLIVVVPRHPQRFDEVARMLQARHFVEALRVARHHDDQQLGWADPFKRVEQQRLLSLARAGGQQHRAPRAKLAAPGPPQLELRRRRR